MAESAPAKVKIPPKPQVQQKKKKKNAPDKPQPAWLFPPDEENPVLNPKHKTDEDTIKETQERDKALSYMKRRVHSVPDRPPPPPQLLTLVGIFLSDFGFNSTSRLFTNERKARQELNGWEDAIGKKIEKGTPTLETIYRDWYRGWKIKQSDETSSSESDSRTSSESDSGVELSTKQATQSSSDDDSEASSDGLGGSDVEMKEAPKVKKGNAKNKRIPASSSTTTSSESDADDEDEKVKPPSTVSKKAESTSKQVATKRTVAAKISSLKRKAASSPSDSSKPSLGSDAAELPQAKKPKTTFKSTTIPAVLPKKSDTKSRGKESSSSSSGSSSPPENSPFKINEGHAPRPTVKPAPVSDSRESASASASYSDSDSDAPAHAPPAKSAVLTKPSAQLAALVQAPSSDSSVTINGDSKKPSASMSSASEASSATSSESSHSNSKSPLKASPKKSIAEKTKKKHEGAKQTPLAALSANAVEDSYISNKYQNYDYADRAYKDLSVTRGKGFTKEKNKKKRGSYRGGAIDTSGGKGFKFED